MRTLRAVSGITTASIFYAAVFAASVFAQNDGEGGQKFFFSVSGGSYKVPGFILGLDKSVAEHPKRLSGFSAGASGGLRFGGKWALGVHVFRMNASGNGPWARSDTAAELAANGVEGTISGRTNWNLDGFAVEAERTFLPRAPVSPYARFGGGLGKLKVAFNGKMAGHETASGTNQPVEEPASDFVKRRIPIVSAEGGVRTRLFKNHFRGFAGALWNTGYGAQTGLRIEF